MDMQELRNAALEVYNELESAGIKPMVSKEGKGLAHASWLCVQIGKKIEDVYKSNRYLGTLCTILEYENFWTHDYMMERAYAWSRGDFRLIAAVYPPEPEFKMRPRNFSALGNTDGRNLRPMQLNRKRP